MTAETESLLDIPPFLRRVPAVAKTRALPKRRIVIPKRKKVTRATKAQVKVMIGLGYNPGTAKQKCREDAAAIIRFKVPPTPRPVQFETT